ncbi:MAG: hypothetical protein IJR70_09250 [Eubacterium sp.]|nr:hypothetical protein [Eubacterium sp.]
MNLGDYIHEAVFEDKYTYLFDLFWENFEEDGFVVCDEEGNEVDCIFKTVAIQNLICEFVYRLYDEINETDFESVVKYLADLGISESEIIEYCEKESEIDVDENDDGATIKNALDWATQIVADKLLEMFSSTDLFDYFFTATYDFEQDFTFEFEDTDEFLAFVDSNQEKLDAYKEEYISVLSWIDSGMIV